MLNNTKIIDFKKYSSIKIGPVLEVLEINEIGDYSNYQIIGRANNLLISPNTNKKFAVLGEAFDYIKQEGNLLYVGCATTSGKLLTYTRNNDIANLEFLAKLPGNLGGLVKMNAGLKSWEMFNYIHSIKTKDGYNNGNCLKVYYSTSYTPGSDIGTTSKVNITNNFAIASGTTSGYATNFTNSGDFVIPSSVTGNGFFIFEYTGNGAGGVTTTIQIDDVKLIP